LFGKLEPADGFLVIVQHVVCEAELEHDGEIERVVFMGNLEVFENVLHVARFHAAIGHELGIERDFFGRGIGIAGLRAGCLRQLERSADAIGQLDIFSIHDALEQRQGADSVVAREIEKTELRGRQQIVGRAAGDDFELVFGFILVIHAQEKISQLAA